MKCLMQFMILILSILIEWNSLQILYKVCQSLLGIHCSIAVVGNVGALSVTSSTPSINSLSCLAVGNDSRVESFLSSWNTLGLALPCFQGWWLESTSVGEGKSPWTSDLSNFVHLIQVEGGFLFWLTAWQEGDGSHGRWDGSWKSTDSVPGNLFWWSLGGAISTLGNHVRLKEASF